MLESARSLGALVTGSTTTFRVWAPGHASVDLVLEDRAAAPRPLFQDADGYWQGEADDVHAGARYRYRLDGRDDQVFPDPASRFQPDGVHQPSEVVDPATFRWTDDGWQPPAFRDVVFYELHVGTFTPEGTYRAVIDRLPYLASLGVTAIELMPVADFPGAHNWGYDGAALFAPARCYGSPDDLRALVDAAHRHRLAVFLDVVYNHFGPDGAYANAFSPYYFTDAHRSPWGRGVNLDGAHNRPVRRFFIENALHWVSEYHFDGLRLDATHALQDTSRPHFLAELTTTVREQAGRQVMFVAEDHRNLTRLVTPVSGGGDGLDGVWADDFHHQLRVRTAHDNQGYYRDFSGSAADLATTIRQGWFFTGQHSGYLGEPRGTDPSRLSPRSMIICIQNHDQIGNRADGARLNQHIDAAAYRAATTLLLLAPETPLLFMGEEWAAESPFLFFTDHGEELGRMITEGRRNEFGAFSAFADADARQQIPDPQDPETFRRSRLDWQEPLREPHAAHVRLHQRLLAIRRGSAAVRDATRASVTAVALDHDTVALGLACADGDALLVVARLSSAGEVSLPFTGDGNVLITTEDDAFVGQPMPISVAWTGPAAAESTPRPQLLRPQLNLRFERAGAVVVQGRGLRLAT
jgi:maltooligosyltrehalose trehalohydrolase